MSTSQIATILFLGASLLATEFSTVGAQLTDADLIDFSQFPGFADLRQCVRDCFGDCKGCSYNNPQVAQTVGCGTNKCLCSRSSTFQLAFKGLTPCVKPCGTLDDTEIAKQLFIDYCAMHDYHPSTDTPTIAPEEGASGSSAVAEATSIAPPAESSIVDIPVAPTLEATLSVPPPGASTGIADELGTTVAATGPTYPRPSTASKTEIPGYTIYSNGAGLNLPSTRYELITVWATIALGLPWILTQVWQ